MRKLIILITFIMTCLSISAGSLIYTPYYRSMAVMRNGKVSAWSPYETVRSSSIFVSTEKVEFSFPETTFTFYSYKKKSKGTTKSGGTYIYYQGLRSKNGTVANMRIDFTTDEWVIISLYIPEITGGPNCIRCKCKFLTEY